MVFLLVVSLVSSTHQLQAQSIYDQQNGSAVYPHGSAAYPHGSAAYPHGSAAAYSGDYRYAPGQKVYLKNHSPDDRNGAFDRFWQGTATAMNGLNGVQTISDTVNDGGLSVGASAGFGFGAFGLQRSNIDTFSADPRFLHVNLGPLMFDEFMVGAGVIWADENGVVPGSNGDDGWGGLGWASMRVSLMLSDSFILSLRPSVFWAYTGNRHRVGWLANPFSATMGPNILGQLSYDFNIDNWRFHFYDRLGTSIAAGRWLTFPTQQTSSSSVIDQVGRYGFNAQGQIADWDITERSSLGNWEDYLRFYNLVGLEAATNLSERTTLQTYISKADLWNSNFEHKRGAVTAGINISSSGPFLQPYAGYNVTTRQPYDVYGHQVLTGAKFRLRPDLTGDASLGYVTFTGIDKRRESWLGRGSLLWEMSPYTSHFIGGGRRVLDSVYLPLSLDDYLEYRLAQQIGFNSTLTFIAGTVQREQLEGAGRGGQDSHINYAALALRCFLSENLRVSAVSGYENIDRGSLDLQRWTHRLNLETLLTETIGLQSVYQYVETTGSFDFTEHMVFLGVAKRF